MTDRPIIFSGPMVRALLDGRKTQTRRALSIKGYKGFHQFGRSDTPGFDWTFRRADCVWEDFEHDRFLKLLPYAVGDRLWVRETWNVPDAYLASERRETALGLMNYAATPWAIPGRWRPSIHMPRWASRMTLVVTDVRVQRLQEISREECVAEACSGWIAFDDEDGEMPEEEFQNLWNSLHGPDAWGANPWVVALTFDVHKCNIDQMGEAA